MNIFVHWINENGGKSYMYYVSDNCRDRADWPASLPYIRKIHISVAVGTQSNLPSPMVKIWGSSKNDQIFYNSSCCIIS